MLIINILAKIITKNHSDSDTQTGTMQKVNLQRLGK